MNIDAHQHFWQYSREEFGWIGEQEQVLQRDFLPSDLKVIFEQNNVDGCIAVQARQSMEETEWLLSLAEHHAIVKGVVGWIDLSAVDLQHRLDQFSAHQALKGFRHVLQDEPDPDFMLAPEFINGVRTLAKNNYSYDILVFSYQLAEVCKFVSQLPVMRLVLDHIAKPQIAAGVGYELWCTHINELASYQHVYCKVSGMVTEASHNNWQPEQFTKYLDVVFAAFGPERIMFGSDWPVCLLAAEYQQVKAILENYVKQHYPDHLSQVFGKNAIDFYQL